MQLKADAWVFGVAVMTLFATPALAASTASVAPPSATASPNPQSTLIPAAPAWTFSTGVSDVELPAKFFNGVIVIRMTVGGRGLDMLLDSGTGFNIMDPAVISSIATPDASASLFTIAEAQFGSAALHNIRFAPRSFERRYGTDQRVVGILGFNFLQSAVVKIDYEHESVHVINPAAFSPPREGAVLALDPTARVPLVSASIGTASGTSFIIDTGAATVVVFPRLAKANPNEFTVKQELRDDAQTKYFRSFWPVCGEIQQNPYAISQISVGEVGIRDWTVWKPDDKSCFSPPGIDGLIGYDFLRLFNVYIDYASNRVILEPNKLYEIATNTIKP